MPIGGENISVKTSDGRTLDGGVFIKSEASDPDYLIVFFHGNACSASGFSFVVDDTNWLKNLNNTDLLFPEYAGYSNNQLPLANNDKFLSDAEDWIKQSLKRHYKKVIVIGHSLGTPAAARV